MSIDLILSRIEAEADSVDIVSADGSLHRAGFQLGLDRAAAIIRQEMGTSETQGEEKGRLTA